MTTTDRLNAIIKMYTRCTIQRDDWGVTVGVMSRGRPLTGKGESLDAALSDVHAAILSSEHAALDKANRERDDALISIAGLEGEVFRDE